MDARRTRIRAESEQTRLSTSNATLPGLILLAIGIVALVTSIILLVAYGFPSDVSEKPESLSGTITLCVGGVLSIAGIIVALYLKHKNDRRKKEKVRPRRARITPSPPPSYSDIQRQKGQPYSEYHDNSYISAVA